MPTHWHIKIVIDHLSQYDRGKRPKLLTTFDVIYFLLDLAASRICKEATVSKCAGAELGSS
jgi:hypothetical protein